MGYLAAAAARGCRAISRPAPPRNDASHQRPASPRVQRTRWALWLAALAGLLSPSALAAIAASAAGSAAPCDAAPSPGVTEEQGQQHGAWQGPPEEHGQQHGVWQAPREEQGQQHGVWQDSREEQGQQRSVWQGTRDYWREYWRGTWRWFSARYFGEALPDLPDPVVQVWRSAQLSEKEVEEVRRQQEVYYRDDSVHSVRVTLRVSMPIFVLSLLAFEILLRGRADGFRRALGVPRLAFPPEEVVAILGGDGSGGPPFGMPDPSALKRQGSEVPSTASTAWSRRALQRQVRCRLAEMLRAVLTIDDAKVVECAGLDALVMLRFCALCGRFCALAGTGCLLLVPLYSAGGWWMQGGGRGLSRFTMANLGQGSSSLWAVVPAAYGCTMALCGLLWQEYERFVQLRRNHLGGESLSRPGASVQAEDNAASWAADFPWQRGWTPPSLQTTVQAGDPGPDSVADAHQGDPKQWETTAVVEQTRRTVLVERLPRELQDPAVLRACFEELLGAGTVHSVAMVPRDARKLSEMLQERARLLREGEDFGALAALEECLRNRREDYGREMAGKKVLIPSFPRNRAGFQLDFSSSVPSHPSDLADQQEPSFSGTLWDVLGRGTAAERRMPIFRGGLPGEPASPLVGEPAYPQDLSGNYPAADLAATWTSSTSDDASARGAGWTTSFSDLCIAASLSVRMGVHAIGDAITAVISIFRDFVGISVRRVGQLLPRSALGTPAPTSALNTPFHGEARNWPSTRYLPTGAADRGASCNTSSTAFVTLRTLQSASVACQVVLEEDPVLGSELMADQAPEPRDIVWHNVARPQAQRLVRQFFVEVALCVGLAFWSVPVSLLQAWCSLARWQHLLGPSFQLPLLAHTDLYALLTLYLPVMALLGLLGVLPGVLYRLASRYEGIKSRSALQMVTMQRYWRFQLATIAVTVLSGSISDSVKAILDDPSSALLLLGQSLPKVAVYFLVTVLYSALVEAPVTLLRLPVLAGRAFRATGRQVGHLWHCLHHEAPSEPEGGPLEAKDFLRSPDHAADLSALLLVLLVCTTYATIAPLILPAGLLFFVVKWSVLAVQYLYVHVPRFDSGGAFWYLLWNQALLALVFGNLTTLALVGLRSGYAQLPFLLPLPVLPMGFKLRAEYCFKEPSRRLSLRLARALDARDPHLADCFTPDAYWHPALRLAEGDWVAPRPREKDRCPLDSLFERLETEESIASQGQPRRMRSDTWPPDTESLHACTPPEAESPRCYHRRSLSTGSLGKLRLPEV